MICSTVLALLLGCYVYGYPSGPPPVDLVCQQMTPSLQAHGPSQSGNGGYMIRFEPSMNKSGSAFQYDPGHVYIVELVGVTHTFKGFLIQARNPATPPPNRPDLIGRFSLLDAVGQHTLNCDTGGVATEATVTHSNPNEKSFVRVIWTAPMENGSVDFFYTVVREQKIHFDHLSAATEGPPPFQDAPPNTLPPIKEPEDYRLHFETPLGCSCGSCSVYVAIDTNRGNDSWIDIYLEGVAEGWVGVGFSHTPNMPETDAVACNRLGDDMVVLDLFNVRSPHLNSLTDRIQDVYLFSSNYTNGLLSCRVIKRIKPSNDFDILLNQDLYVLYGKRSSAAINLTILSPHDFDTLPQITSSQLNVVTLNGTSGSSDFTTIKKILTKTHGSLMLIAWPLLAVTAIFFPVFMKPALPGGQWFLVHRVLMLLSVGVAVVGFVLIFVAQLNQSPSGLIPLGVGEGVRTSHFTIGLLVMILQLINPIVGILRCKPDSPHRWLLNLIHRLVGLSALLLALTNSGLGAWLIDPTHKVLWVVVGWEGLFLVVIVILVVVFTTAAVCYSTKYRAPSTIQGFFDTPALSPVSFKSSSGEKNRLISIKSSSLVDSEQLISSCEAVLRWTSLIVFLTLSVLAVIAAVVLLWYQI